MSAQFWLGLFQLFLVVGGALAVSLFIIDRLFPPVRQTTESDTANVRRLRIGPASTANPPPLRWPLAPAWLPQYWQENLRLVGPLLVIWLLSFVLPVVLSAPLNQISILTGFPLGYYMSAQGTLICFVVLVFVYNWRMHILDRRYGVDPPETPDAQQIRRRYSLRYLGFTIGLLVLLIVFIILETQFRLPSFIIDWSFLTLTIGLYAVIGIRSRADTLDAYYVAERKVPGILNGLATGSDWMSAASFISMAGALYLLGFEGLAYITGWTGGYVLLALLLAPYLRKFGQYTLVDFIGARYPGAGARVIAAVLSIIICFTYVTAQVTGIGIIMSRFLGLNYMVGVIVGLAAVLLCSYLGGMKAITWTQGVQGIILVFAYLVPVTWLAFKLTGVALPQVMYGEALSNIDRLEQAQGLASYVAPFNDWSIWNYLALSLCLMLGTAGMPHILVRFYTVPTVRDSRSSVAWALVWICVLYLTAPAYAAFSRWEILSSVVGRPVAGLPEWTNRWASTGLLKIADDPAAGGNGDGILQYQELQIDQDLVVLSMPEIAELPSTVVALVAAGGMAAALSTADGLLMVIASATVHDIYHRTLNPRASSRERLFLGRLAILVVAILAALTALQRLAIIVQLVAWAFSFAAATIFPVLVLGIFWKRTNSRGAVAGMISGFLVTASYMAITYILPEWTLFGISSSAAGIFGLPVNFLVTWLVSRYGPPPDPEVTALVDYVRYP
ncbi:MAG: VC_2705 family sodium/solute symporter [Chloroflexus sp.]|jgi:cation/acetate symporter|uniref:VC_2705 family sodium/solute symporter n=1 Tax=Chloroflexus sp. TaxID=1904827 RepID=UPI0030A11E87